MDSIRSYIERSLNVQLVDHPDRQTYTVYISEVAVADLVENKFAALEWQDPNARDCGLGDGLLYVYLPDIDEEVGELFIAIDCVNNTLTFC